MLLPICPDFPAGSRFHSSNGKTTRSNGVIGVPAEKGGLGGMSAILRSSNLGAFCQGLTSISFLVLFVSLGFATPRNWAHFVDRKSLTFRYPKSQVPVLHTYTCTAHGFFPTCTPATDRGDRGDREQRTQLRLSASRPTPGCVARSSRSVVRPLETSGSTPTEDQANTGLSLSTNKWDNYRDTYQSVIQSLYCIAVQKNALLAAIGRPSLPRMG